MVDAVRSSTVSVTVIESAAVGTLAKVKEPAMLNVPPLPVTTPVPETAVPSEMATLKSEADDSGSPSVNDARKGKLVGVKRTALMPPDADTLSGAAVTSIVNVPVELPSDEFDTVRLPVYVPGSSDDRSAVGFPDEVLTEYDIPLIVKLV